MEPLELGLPQALQGETCQLHLRQTSEKVEIHHPDVENTNYEVSAVNRSTIL